MTDDELEERIADARACERAAVERAKGAGTTDDMNVLLRRRLAPPRTVRLDDPDAAKSINRHIRAATGRVLDDKTDDAA